MKLAGVLLDKYLSWNEHRKYIENKCSAKILVC